MINWQDINTDEQSIYDDEHLESQEWLQILKLKKLNETETKTARWQTPYGVGRFETSHLRIRWTALLFLRLWRNQTREESRLDSIIQDTRVWLRWQVQEGQIHPRETKPLL